MLILFAFKIITSDPSPLLQFNILFFSFVYWIVLDIVTPIQTFSKLYSISVDVSFLSMFFSVTSVANSMNFVCSHLV